MAAPTRDLKKDTAALHDLQAQILHPNSAFNKRIRALEQQYKAGGATPEQLEAAKLQELYSFTRNDQFGGSFPDTATIEAIKQQDLQQRAELLAQTPEGVGLTPAMRLKQVQDNAVNGHPLAQQLSTLQTIRDLYPEEQVAQPVAISAKAPAAAKGAEGSKASTRQPRAAPAAAPKLAGGPQTDEDKLTEAQLTMLYNLALGNKGIEPTMYEQE